MQNRCCAIHRHHKHISYIYFVCLLFLFQVGIYNTIKTNKNQPSSLYKKQPKPSYKETLSKSTDYDPFLYELGVPWCANYK